MRLELLITTAQGTETREWDDLTELTVGRNAALSLADEEVSRRHATIYVGSDGGLHIRDEGSTNGTMVDGKKVTDAALTTGSVITVGDSRLEVLHCDGALPASSTDAPIVLNQWPDNLRALPKDDLEKFVDHVDEKARKESKRIQDFLKKKKS